MTTTFREFPGRLSATKRIVGALARLALLTAILVAGAAPVKAQDAGESAAIYLPILLSDSAPSTDGPYAQMLETVNQLCGAVGLNQVCYVRGQVDVTPLSGAAGFGQPGAIADLANVDKLSVTSNGPDSEEFSVAVLRLRANAATPDTGLTVLAFGNVDISQFELFTAPADLEKAETLPSLHVSSSPISQTTRLGSSGLIVTNPSEEELLSLTVNGAAITLGSTALVEATPGEAMTVTMATGSSRTEAHGGESTAVQNQQVSVPL